MEKERSLGIPSHSELQLAGEPGAVCTGMCSRKEDQEKALIICDEAQIKVKLDIPKTQPLKHFLQMSLVVEDRRTHSQYVYLFGFFKFMPCSCNSKTYPCLFQFTYSSIPQLSVGPYSGLGTVLGPGGRAVNRTWSHPHEAAFRVSSHILVESGSSLQMWHIGPGLPVLSAPCSWGYLGGCMPKFRSSVLRRDSAKEGLPSFTLGLFCTPEDGFSKATHQG